MRRKRWLRWLVLSVWVLSALAALPRAGWAQAGEESAGAPTVVVLRLEGAVNPIWQETIQRALQLAEREAASAVVLELDTPGGSITVMNSLVQQVRASDIPVIVYVSPAGAMAASAGTLVTLAGHAAVMAPETTIGAASPVGAQGEDIGTTEAAKVKEVLKASARGLAARRGQGAVDLAEEMIDDARAVSAEEALQAGLVDAVAGDLDSLLTQMDGRTVQVGDAPVTLHTAGAQVVEAPSTLLEQLLQMITDPNLVFLLLSVGVQAILIELSSPGGWVAGFIGVVCVALAVFGMGVLPVNWFGLVFLLTSFVLFVLDVKAPTHGALTAAGTVSFIVGALVLFNSPSSAGFPQVSVPLVVGTGIFFGLAFTGILTFALSAQRIPARMGQSTLAQQVGVARSELNPEGSVQLGSELWSATLEDGGRASKGSRVAVVRAEGIRLVVRKLD